MHSAARIPNPRCHFHALRTWQLAAHRLCILWNHATIPKLHAGHTPQCSPCAPGHAMRQQNPPGCHASPARVVFARPLAGCAHDTSTLSAQLSSSWRDSEGASRSRSDTRRCGWMSGATMRSTPIASSTRSLLSSVSASTTCARSRSSSSTTRSASFTVSLRSSPPAPLREPRPSRASWMRFSSRFHWNLPSLNSTWNRRSRSTGSSSVSRRRATYG
mmetsp:Transcript_17299/g.43391  ORF Transcript_17299/g.43391 Transcript_17299/m.43391 type:complete len:217 (+) Transcript_17299:655-1305(+)